MFGINILNILIESTGEHPVRDGCLLLDEVNNCAIFIHFIMSRSGLFVFLYIYIFFQPVKNTALF